MEQNKKTNYGKIFAVMAAFVVGVCTVMWFGVKLYRKYCLLDHEDTEFDGFEDENDGADCEVVMDNEAEEKPEEEKAATEEEQA